MTECGLTFHPFVATDSFYYVDATNPSRYINLSNYYDTIRAEKEAELQKIAYDLGAKRCMLECEQASISIRSKQWAAKGKAKASPTEQAGIDATCAINQESKAKRHALFVQEYEGNPEPNEPELHWYRNDPCIEQLVRSRCSGEGKALVTHYERQISTHSSMAIDINAAAKIDAALERMNASANVSFKGKAKDEAREKLTFIVDF